MNCTLDQRSSRIISSATFANVAWHEVLMKVQVKILVLDNESGLTTEDRSMEDPFRAPVQMLHKYGKVHELC